MEGSNSSSTDLTQVEMLCQAFYGGDSIAQREAHEVLLPLVENSSNISKLQSILANSTNLQALLFSTSALNKLFTLNWTQIPELQKTETRQFLLNYLYTRGPEMLVNAPVILGNFVRLLCRIVKLSWLENVANQNIVEQVSQYLQASTSHWVVGLNIYTELTQDMQPQLGPNMARYRRTALAFKDSALPEIFQVAIQTLQQFHSGAILVSNRNEEDKLLKQVLQLTLNCLSFDFMATMNDENNEQSTVIIPHSWTILREENIPKMFFDIYSMCWCFKDSSCASNATIVGGSTVSTGGGAAVGVPLPGNSTGTPRVDCAVLCLSCLVLVSALRRSFFLKEEERLRHLGELIEGTTKVIKHKIGLMNDNCFHELCRLLGKINASNELSELCASEDFGEWTGHLFEFTIQALEDWKRLPNSKHYLLGVWAHMVNPLMSMKDPPKDLDKFIHQITLAYIESRMRIAENYAMFKSNTNNQEAVGAEETNLNILEEDDDENPLNNEVLRTEQLDVLAQLGRFNYADTCHRVMDLFQTTKNEMQMNAISKRMFQEKITWLVYMIGAFVGSDSFCRASTRFNRTQTNTDGSPTYVLNGEISSLVFQLIEETNSCSCETIPECLELSYIFFLDQFRKIYVGEQAKHIVQQNSLTAGERLAKVFGLKDDDSVLDLLIQKIGYNLQQRYLMELVLKKTLNFFHELASGINIVHCLDRSPHLIVSGRLMLKNKTVQFILNNHTHPSFKFLFLPKYGKYRTNYYFTLGKLLFMEIRGDKEKFEGFMQPLCESFENLSSQILTAKTIDGSVGDSSVVSGAASPFIVNNNNDYLLKCNELKHPVIALCRDLRGICMACNSVDSYNLLFNWLVNKPKQQGLSRIHLFTWAANVWWSDSSVIIPILKFMSEFVSNKAQRITFDQASANGILLFKQVSSIILNYANRVLKKNEFVDMYREKYKGLAITLEMFSYTLSGNYVNFGVFEVYQDNALTSSLQLAFQMCLAIPERDLQAYIKTLKSYYSFLDLAARHFMIHILELVPSDIRRLLSSVEDGLCSFESPVTMQCCSIVDSFVTYFFNMKDKNNTYESVAIRRFMEEEPQALKRILQLMFQLVITGEFSCTWSMSRPLLGLILLHENEFILIKQQLENQHVDEKKIKLQQYFSELMQGVQANLSAKNKDLFTRNLYHFAQMIRNL